MNINKTNESLISLEILALLEHQPEFKESPEVRVSIKRNGFTMIDKVAERYLHCDILEDSDGIQLEGGNLDGDYSGLVMKLWRNGSSTWDIASDIHKWFTVNDGELFEVPANDNSCVIVIKREAGKITRYKRDTK